MRKYYGYYSHKNNKLELIFCRDYIYKKEICIYDCDYIECNDYEWIRFERNTIKEERKRLLEYNIKQIPKKEVKELLFINKL